MPRPPNPERLTKLVQRFESVKRQLKAAKAEEKKQARRDDTRAKIIAGALALEHTEKNPDSDFARTMLRLLDQYARPDERRLFQILGPSPASASHETGDGVNSA